MFFKLELLGPMSAMRLFFFDAADDPSSPRTREAMVRSILVEGEINFLGPRCPRLTEL